MLNKTRVRYVFKDSSCSYTLRFILSREREELTNLRFKTKLRLSGIGCDLKSTSKYNKLTGPETSGKVANVPSGFEHINLNYLRAGELSLLLTNFALLSFEVAVTASVRV